MPYELLKAEQCETALFFSLSGDKAERHGAIGYLRADFGRSGKEFWTTWFDNQNHLKSSSFKTELDNVINALRDDGKTPPFASRINLEKFCANIPGEKFDNRGDGYMIRTLDFSYYFRCKPTIGDYDIYCFAYDNDYLLPELAGKHKMPNKCYSVLPSSGELIQITYGEKGYSPSDGSKPNPEENRFFADTSNKILGITRAQEQAMLVGSMFGWAVPAAKPWNYDQNGKPRPLPPKNKEQER